MLVLVHFFLRNPILIGKKKTAHVQYYTEVVEASQNLDQLRRNSYDPDELEEEQRERALRRRLNDMFKDFCKRVEEIARKHQAVVEFDRPYRELGFFGVAMLSRCLLPRPCFIAAGPPKIPRLRTE